MWTVPAGCGSFAVCPGNNNENSPQNGTRNADLTIVFLSTLSAVAVFPVRRGPPYNISQAVLMKTVVLIVALAGAGWALTADNGPAKKKTGPSKAGNVGAGAADIGKGAAKGAGHLAKGTAKGVVDAATLHPIDGAAAIAGGAASAGKDVAVGTVKGTGKVARGVGQPF